MRGSPISTLTANNKQCQVFSPCGERSRFLRSRSPSLRSLPVVRGPDTADDLLCFSRGRGDKLSLDEHLETERGHPADSSLASDWLRTFCLPSRWWSGLIWIHQTKSGSNLVFIRLHCNLFCKAALQSSREILRSNSRTVEGVAVKEYLGRLSYLLSERGDSAARCQQW